MTAFLATQTVVVGPLEEPAAPPGGGPTALTATEICKSVPSVYLAFLVKSASEIRRATCQTTTSLSLSFRSTFELANNFVKSNTWPCEPDRRPASQIETTQCTPPESLYFSTTSADGPRWTLLLLLSLFLLTFQSASRVPHFAHLACYGRSLESLCWAAAYLAGEAAALIECQV